MLAKEHASAFEPGDHGSTFGGNPLACAAAIAVFQTVLEQDLPARAERTGAYFRERLQALQARWPAIREVRGRGLLIAMEFDREVSAALLDAARERGVLLNAVSPTIVRFMPPLIIAEAEIDRAVAVLDEALAATLASPVAGG